MAPGSTVENASALTEPVDVGSVTLIVASVLEKPDGSVAVTSTWRARTSASAANAACRAAGSDEITWPWPAVASCCSASSAAPSCVEGDDVGEDLGVLDLRGCRFDGRGAGVGAVREHQQAALALGAGDVDGLDHAVVQPGLTGQGQPVEDGLGGGAVGRRVEDGGHLAGEGDDADVDVCRGPRR